MLGGYSAFGRGSISGGESLDTGRLSRMVTAGLGLALGGLLSRTMVVAVCGPDLIYMLGQATGRENKVANVISRHFGS